MEPTEFAEWRALPPLDHKTAQAVGAALGNWVIESKPAVSEVVIGMDTRESGPWLAADVAGGLASRGVAVEFAGVTTTPGVAYLAKNGPFAAGVMISASHNPYQDNGIKLIGHAGYKLPDDEEERLETEIFALLAQNLNLDAGAACGGRAVWIAPTNDHLASTLPGGLERIDAWSSIARTVRHRRSRLSYSRAWARAFIPSIARPTAATSI